MAKDNGGGNTPPVREVGDAPDITRMFTSLPQPECEKYYYASFSSPEKLAAYLKEFKSDDCWYGSNVWREMDERFTGVDSIHEAIDMAYHGWKEGGEACEKARGYIRALNPLSPRMVKYGIAGSTPNVPRAIAGNILNMRVAENKNFQRKRKNITLVYNMCEPWYVGKDAITNKAAVTAALVDEMEGKGFSVEVIAVAATGSHSVRAMTSVCVKESHQPVDINRLAFALGHSAMFRGMMFGTWQCDSECEGLGYGLGHVSTTVPTKESNEELRFTITSGVCYDERPECKPVNMKFFSDLKLAATKGLDGLVRQLQLQGCPALEKKEHEDVLAEETDEEEKLPEWDYDW